MERSRRIENKFIENSELWYTLGSFFRVSHHNKAILHQEYTFSSVIL